MNTIQYKLFETIRQRTKDPRRWVDEIAGVLNKSKYAVYKKIQGDSSLTFEELITLAQHYQLHIDPVIRPETVLSFEFPFQDPAYRYHDYLSSIQMQMDMASSLPDARIWHTGIELPFIHDHCFPDIVAFKFFIHSHTVWGDTDQKPAQFDLAAARRDSPQIRMIRDVLHAYYRFPTTEIWNTMILDITLSQIRYTLESRMLAVPEDAFALCDALSDFVKHMEKMAETGIKTPPEGGSGSEFELYHNEIAHSMNVIMLKSAYGDTLYLGFGNPQFMYSQAKPAVDNMNRWLQMLRSNATPITRESRKERTAFFDALHKKIARARTEIDAILKMQAL